MPGEAASEPDRVRVVVVDDDEGMRLLLRLQFELDGRFDVVGEGADGLAAIDLAEALQPDLMVIALHMPGLSTVDAIPEIRRRATESAVMLYTLKTGDGTYRAALSAGALDVLDKRLAAHSFVDHLVGGLLEQASPSHATIEVRIGPVPADAARVWVANTERILDAVTANPDVLGATIPDDVLEFFRSLLREWADVASGAEEFSWAARARPDDVSRIVSYWGFIDAMTDEQLEKLGVQWSSPAGEQPFFRALTDGVLDALRRHEETQRLAARLTAQWQPS